MKDCKHCGTPVDTSTDDGCGCDGEIYELLEAELAALNKRAETAEEAVRLLGENSDKLGQQNAKLTEAAKAMLAELDCHHRENSPAARKLAVLLDAQTD